MSMEVGSSNAYLANPRHSWWSTQTTKEKKLFIACAIVSILAIIFLICTIGLGAKKYYEPNCVFVQDPDKVHNKTCNTKVCKEIAFQLKMNMNEDVDPCDNFYNFACGGFEQIHNVNEETGSLALKEFMKQIGTILQQGKPEEQKNKAAKSVLYLYDKCVKHGSDEKDTENVKNLMAEILNTSWPIAAGASWNETDFNWASTLAKLIRIDPGFIVQLKIQPDRENCSLLEPWLMLGRMPINLPPNIKDIVRKVYPDSTPDKIDEDIKHLNDTVNDLKALGVSILSKLSDWPKEENSKIMKANPDQIKMFKKFSIKELATATPITTEVTWKTFFETLLPGQVGDNFEITTTIDIAHFLSSMETDKRILANFIGLRLVQLWGSMYSNDIMKLWDPEANRANMCYTFVDQTLGFALAKMHTDSYMLPNVVQQIEGLNKDVLNAFKQLVNEANWLEDTTRIKAIQKVNNLEDIVVFPKWVLDKDSLEKHYKDVEPVKDKDFVEGSRLAIQNYFQQQVQQIGTKMDRKNYWPPEQQQLVNAFYHPLTNAMYYFRGIIMNPFYAPGRPRAVNYGSIGVTIGHEITHGFDSEGKGFDENGLVNDWWDATTENKFQEKATCFRDQYSIIKDELTNENLNGISTLAENIADSGGLRASFQAYKSSPPDNVGKLIGLEGYTDDQLFFISAVQLWCNRHDANKIRNQIQKDPHSPYKYRAILPYKNFPEFSKAFECKEGSNMNLANPCRIW